VYKCNIHILKPNERVLLLNIIKSYSIEYRLEHNELLIFEINEEIEDFLEFHEIFPDKI